MNPFFTVILQTTLRHYEGAASGREDKLRRAIDSVLNQSYTNFELLVMCDNCTESFNIAKTYTDERVSVYLIKESIQGKWFSYCRNYGIMSALGEYILYIDNDDIYKPDYLKELHAEIMHDFASWYCVDNMELKNNKWVHKRVNLVANSAGTANIVHRRNVRSRWLASGTYGTEDWRFIKSIIGEGLKNRHLDIAGYYVCHIRGRYDI